MHKFQEIRELKDTEVLCVKKTGPYAESAKEAWVALTEFTGPKNLHTDDTKFIGICYDDPGATPAEEIRYDACITYSGDVELTGDVAKQTISGGKYAVFLHKGPYEKVGEVYDFIYKEWLPQNGHEINDEPCLELYLNNCMTTPPVDLLTEIHIKI